MNIAAIDIGSNAVRLSISKVSKNLGHHDPKDLIEKHRFPCRLGTDVFKHGNIGAEKEKLLHSIFKELQKVIKKHKVERCVGFATSAFRDSKNGAELLKSLSEKYKVPCKIISGLEEARHMSQGLLTRGHFDGKGAHLHADIGGGSLELSVHHDGQFVFQKSLDLGTIRLILDTQSGQLIPHYSKSLNLIDDVLGSKEVVKFIDMYTSDNFEMHGTGGNFKRIGKLRTTFFEKKDPKKIRRDEVPMLLGICANYSGRELSHHSPIKEDNAPLIVPSLLIIQRILNFWPAEKVRIPNLSLSHTILDEMN